MPQLVFQIGHWFTRAGHDRKIEAAGGEAAQRLVFVRWRRNHLQRVKMYIKDGGPAAFKKGRMELKKISETLATNFDISRALRMSILITGLGRHYFAVRGKKLRHTLHLQKIGSIRITPVNCRSQMVALKR